MQRFGAVLAGVLVVLMIAGAASAVVNITADDGPAIEASGLDGGSTTTVGIEPIDDVTSSTVTNESVADSGDDATSTTMAGDDRTDHHSADPAMKSDDNVTSTTVADNRHGDDATETSSTVAGDDRTDHHSDDAETKSDNATTSSTMADGHRDDDHGDDSGVGPDDDGTTTTTSPQTALSKLIDAGEAGSVTIIVQDGNVTIAAVAPGEGWTYQVEQHDAGEAKVEFRSGGVRVRVKAEFEHGDLRVDVERRTDDS